MPNIRLYYILSISKFAVGGSVAFYHLPACVYVFFQRVCIISVIGFWDLFSRIKKKQIFALNYIFTW